MSIKDYARNHKKRKEDTQQSGLLMVGVDGSEVRHYDCMGARAGVICRKLGFTHACGGFNRNIL